MDIQIRPVRDVVFAEVVKPGETRRESGVFLLNPIATKSTRLARVIAVGDGDMMVDKTKMVNIKINVGDIIVINEFGGQSVSAFGQEYILIPYSDIFGVWENWAEMEIATVKPK